MLMCLSALVNPHITDFTVPSLCVSENPAISGDKGNITDAGGCPPPSMLTQSET